MGINPKLHLTAVQAAIHDPRNMHNRVRRIVHFSKDRSVGKCVSALKICAIFLFSSPAFPFLAGTRMYVAYFPIKRQVVDIALTTSLESTRFQNKGNSMAAEGVNSPGIKIISGKFRCRSSMQREHILK